MATAAQNVQKTGENTYAVDRDFHLKRCISMLQGALEHGKLTQRERYILYRMLLNLIG